MKELNLPNVTLIALAACCFLQFGGQLFALTVVASTVAEAPPRSFAILEGEYRYDSSPFWNTVPPITFVLFIIALATNWNNRRRKLIVFALSLFLVGGFIAYLLLEPFFADMIARGYSDQVDPVLQNRAARWYLLDCMVWGLGFLAGLTLLVALIWPIKVPTENTAASSQ